MTGTFKDNSAENRFEYHTQGTFAHADYRVEGGTLFIDYVEAPPELRGTGAAGKLMSEIVSHAAGKGLSITPICGYAASWLKRNPPA